MNKEKAYKILGLKSGASENEIKKRFRKLAKEKHPDRNKDPNAEEEYKQISASFEYLKNPPPEPSSSFNPFSGMGINISDFINPFRRHTQHRTEILQVSVDISFEESVKSCQRQISTDKDIYCVKCRGNGATQSTERCPRCNGTGYIENNSVVGNRKIRMRTTCVTCNTTGKQLKDCQKCAGSGVITVKSTLEIRIPGGILDKQVMRLTRMGHLGTDAFLKVNVKSAQNMSMSGIDVISNVSISLLEALKGSKKDVKTVFGDKNIKIKPNTKHGDQVKLKGLGAEKKGDHIFVVDIEYPKNTKDLIKVLEKGDL